MVNIATFEELRYEICRLAFNYDKPSDLEELYDIDVSNISLYRDFNNVLVSFFLYSKKSKYSPAGEYKKHLIITKKYDVFARNMPYYDGDLDGLLPIYNQVKIYFLIKEKMPQLFNKIK